MFKLFEELESQRSTNEKIKILNTITEQHAQIFNYVYNYKINFYIKKIPAVNFLSLSINDEEQFKHFETLAQNLINRTITGKQAKQAVSDFLTTCNELQCKWYSRIFERNLRCGVQLTLANAAIKTYFPQHTIPVFEIQLCEREKQFKPNHKITYSVEPKLDGVRAIYLSWEKSFYSRDGRKFNNFDFLIESIDKLNLPPKYQSGFVLDSEITYSGDGDSYEEVMKNLQVKHRDTTEELEMTCFDILSKQEWENKQTEIQSVRRAALISIISSSNAAKITIVPQKIVEQLSQEDIDKYRNLACAQGYEGIVIKDINSTYDFRRNKNWIKIKPFETVDVPVIEIEEGTGRNIGTCGTLIFDFFGKSMRVGSGLTDDLRTKFWKDPNLIVGKTIEVKFDKVTGQGGTRFPVFLRVREDK